MSRKNFFIFGRKHFAFVNLLLLFSYNTLFILFLSLPPPPPCIYISISFYIFHSLCFPPPTIIMISPSSLLLKNSSVVDFLYVCTYVYSECVCVCGFWLRRGLYWVGKCLFSGRNRWRCLLSRILSLSIALFEFLIWNVWHLFYIIYKKLRSKQKKERERDCIFCLDKIYQS